MDMYHTRERIIMPLLIAAGCALYMVSGGIRSNFGIIVQALADRTGVSYADVSFAVAVGQLMYGVTQPIFGIVAMKKSNGFVLVLGTLMMAAGLLLTTLARSVIVRLPLPASGAQECARVALWHPRCDRLRVRALAAQDGVYGVPVHRHTGLDRRCYCNAHLGDRVPAVRAGESGLPVRHHLRGPSDRRVYQFLAVRSIHLTEW